MESFFQRRDTEGERQKEREQYFHMQTQVTMKLPVQTYCVEIPWKPQDWHENLEVGAKVDHSPNGNSSTVLSFLQFKMQLTGQPM